MDRSKVTCFTAQVPSRKRHLGYCTVAAHYQDRFKNISTVIFLLRVLSVSNAYLERFFSTMEQVKTYWSGKLGEK